MHLAATLDDLVTHILDNAWQLVGANMRMGIAENGWRSSMLTEDLKNLGDVAALLAACVKLSVAVGSGSSFTETVVAFRIYGLRLADESKILFPLADILPSFDDDGAEPKLDEAQRSEQTAGTLTDDNHMRLATDIGIVGGRKQVVFGHLVDVNSDGEVDEDVALPGIDTLAQHSHSGYRADIESFLFGKPFSNVLLAAGCAG